MDIEEQKEKNIELTFTLVAALIIVIHLIASFFPPGRTWGFHHLLFFPLWFRITLTLTGLLICIPRVNRTILDLLSPIPRILFSEKHGKRYTAFVSLSLLSFILFWLLRTKTHLLGDGSMRIRSLTAGNSFSTIEPLETYLHFLGHKLLSSFNNLDPATTYAILSCLSGTIFIFFLLILSSSWTQGRIEATFVFLSIITMGVIQLFFGYVEHYSFMTTGILLYMLSSLLYFKGKGSIVFPTLILSFTICFHTAVFPLLGSLVYLVFAQRDQIKKESRLQIAVKTCAAFLLPMACLGGLAYHLGSDPSSFWQETGQRIFLPLSTDSSSSSYSLFSFNHIVDLINEQILISPVGIIMLLSLPLILRKSINFKDQTFRFLFLASGGLFIFTFALNPKLGLSRDWDLFSLPAIPYTLMGVYLAISHIKNKKRLKYVGALCITANLLHTVPWVLVNAHESKATDRFKLLIETQTLNSLHYAYEELATYYVNADRSQEGIEYYQKAIEISPNNWRLHILLGARLGELERYDEAITELERAKELIPNLMTTKRDIFLNSLLHYNLGTAYGRKELFQKAILEYEKTIALNPRNADAHFYLGYSYWAENRREEAITAWRRALSINPNHPAAREFLLEAVRN